MQLCSHRPTSSSAFSHYFKHENYQARDQDSRTDPNIKYAKVRAFKLSFPLIASSHIASNFQLLHVIMHPRILPAVIKTVVSIIPLIIIPTFTTSVFTLAIVGLVGPRKGFIYTSPYYLLVDDQNRRFGIYNVPSLYVPSNWAAWLFAIGSYGINQGLGRERSLNVSKHI
jgi:hypothetical protein